MSVEAVGAKKVVVLDHATEGKTAAKWIDCSAMTRGEGASGRKRRKEKIDSGGEAEKKKRDKVG